MRSADLGACAPDVNVRGAGVSWPVNGVRRDPVSIFASRLARLWRLSEILPEGHSVLSMEEELVRMASSVCREHLLKSSGVAGLTRERAALEFWIRRLVWAKAALMEGGPPGEMPDKVGDAIGSLFRAEA